MTNTYKQESKNISRHLMIKRAIELLTLERTSSCCVRRTYVRDLYDFFIKQEESHEQEEVKKIDMSYIRAWENMHTENRFTNYRYVICQDLNQKMILQNLFHWVCYHKIYGHLNLNKKHIYKR